VKEVLPLSLYQQDDVPPNDPGAPAAGPAEQNGVGSGPAAEPAPAAPKKGRPKKAPATLQFPNGCTLSEEMDIPVADLVVTQHRDEGEKGKVRLENLAASLKLLGQLYPLIVCDSATGKYSILAGNRRAMAAALAGILTLRCRIFKGPDKAIPHVIAAVENSHREQEAPLTLALKLQRALKEGFDQKALAEMFRKSKGAVSDMLYAVTKLPAAYRKRIESGEGLYKVVTEHRNARRNGLGEPQASAAQPSAAASTGDPPKDPSSEPSTALASEPVHEHPNGRFEHGGVLISIDSLSQEHPPAAAVVVALRHVLNIYEVMARREPG
jgi:ParB/RepB/Spo0J family partition protein